MEIPEKEFLDKIKEILILKVKPGDVVIIKAPAFCGPSFEYLFRDSGVKWSVDSEDHIKDVKIIRQENEIPN
jgi:hypothetical protein